MGRGPLRRWLLRRPPLSPAAAHRFSRLDVWLLRRFGLSLGGAMTGLPMLVLTTVGRRTGRPHPTPLAYLRDGRNLIIVAGNRGASRDPWWMHNLRAYPYATVEMDRRSQGVCATIVEGPGAPSSLAAPPRGHAAHRQLRGTHLARIPVVRLVPIAEPSSHSHRLRHRSRPPAWTEPHPLTRSGFCHRLCVFCPALAAAKMSDPLYGRTLLAAASDDDEPRRASWETRWERSPPVPVLVPVEGWTRSMRIEDDPPPVVVPVPMLERASPEGQRA